MPFVKNGYVIPIDQCTNKRIFVSSLVVGYDIIEDILNHLKRKKHFRRTLTEIAKI